MTGNDQGLDFQSPPNDIEGRADRLSSEQRAQFPGSDDDFEDPASPSRTTRSSPLSAEPEEGPTREKKQVSPLIRYLPQIVIGTLVTGLVGVGLLNGFGGSDTSSVQISAPMSAPQAGPNPFTQASPAPGRTIAAPGTAGYPAPAGVQGPPPASRPIENPQNFAPARPVDNSQNIVSPPSMLQATSTAPSMPMAGATAVPGTPPLLPRPAPQPAASMVDEPTLSAQIESRLKSAIGDMSTAIISRIEASDRALVQYQSRMNAIETKLAALEKANTVERPTTRPRTVAQDNEQTAPRTTRASVNDVDPAPVRVARRAETPEPRAAGVSHSEPTTLVYTLRGANAQEALISPPNAAISDVIRVRPGDSIPGLGKVTEIRQIGQEWIVATERGLITRR